MKIRYIGGIDEVELPDGTTVKRNHQVDVSDELAGHPPEPRLAEAMVELRDAASSFDHHLAVKLRHEIAGLDYGSGLLAQETWEAVAPAAKKKAPAKAAAKKVAASRPVAEPIEPVEGDPVPLLIEDEVPA